MWHQSNWCERVIFLSSGILFLIFLYNTFFHNVSYSLWLILYSLILIISSVWVTCYKIQFLINQNEPLKSNSENFLAKILSDDYMRRALSIFYRKLNLKEIVDNEIDKSTDEPIDARNASIIASVIERKFVWAWYSQYVSKEIAFPFACKELLDQMVVKAFQISSNIQIVDLTADSLVIVLRHLKEYKKSLKRLEKLNKSSVDECYKKFHPTSSQRNSNNVANRGKSTQGHCLSVSKTLLKELLPWELWDTPHAMLISSILAKKMEAFINNSLSDPARLRFWIMQALTKNTENFNVPQQSLTPNQNVEQLQRSNSSESINNVSEAQEKVPEHKEIHVQESNVPTIMKTSIESALSNMISNTTAPILQRAEMEETSQKNVLQNIIPNINSEKKILNTQPINISSAVSSSYEFAHSSNASNPKFKSTNEVKVYDRLLDGSVKTWNNDVDLDCVSLGQDLLASLDGEIGFESRIGRLWEADGSESNEIWSPNPPSTGSSTKTPHGLWFGEEDNLDMDLTEESPPKNTVQTNTTTTYPNFSITKPLGIQNMKELQNISKNTVNQAKNKIGDLQDEAAGVMEGILDLGIAGLKKGLRLTGLQESLQDATKDKSGVVNLKSATESQTNNLVAAIGQVLTSSRKNSQSDETALKLDIQKVNSNMNKNENLNPDKNNTPSQPLHLVKQQRISSQESEAFVNKIDNSSMFSTSGDESIPSIIDPVISIDDSPDYEYEEVEDFASTIAKLRCLLQQKTSDFPPVPAEDALMTDIKSEKRQPSSPIVNSYNTPTHKSISNQSGNVKPETVPHISSIESENGFTILSPNSIELIEAEDVLNQKCLQSEIPLHENNIQKLDKFFTRTVTGVFNSIKTAVGGDSTSEGVISQADFSNNITDKQRVVASISTKDNWIFTKGNVDLSTLVGRLLVERRGYCIVEAAQDSLETIGGTHSVPVNSSEGEASPTSPDDLDETELTNQCPLWHMSMEIISVVLGGVMQKDVLIKCANVVASDGVEKMLQNNLEYFSYWLKMKTIDTFNDLYLTIESSSSKMPEHFNVNNETLCNELIKLIPDIIFTIFGKEEIFNALHMIFSSVDHQLINRDLIFNLLDTFIVHFLKASALRNNGYVSTPPPSA